MLISTVNSVTKYQLKDESDFGKRVTEKICNANAIEEFKAAVTDQATYECISFERLLRRKFVMQAKNMKGSVWNRLMSFKLFNNHSSLQNKVLYVLLVNQSLKIKYQDIVY